MTDIKSRLRELNPWKDNGWPETCREAAAYIERLEAEVARLKSDRLYALGCNDGYDAAMEQAAEFCDGAEAAWRETADKAHELDHNEAMGWSEKATAKAETCAGLASTIRTATTIPLIRGVGLCMLNGKDAEALVRADIDEILRLRKELAEARAKALEEAQDAVREAWNGYGVSLVRINDAIRSLADREPRA